MRIDDIVFCNNNDIIIILKSLTQLYQVNSSKMLFIDSENFLDFGYVMMDLRFSYQILFTKIKSNTINNVLELESKGLIKNRNVRIVSEISL